MPQGERCPFLGGWGTERPFTGSFFVVRLLAVDPRYVVKEFFDMSLGMGAERDYEWLFGAVVRDIRLTAHYMKECMPKTSLVIGEGSAKKPTLFVVQERIEGKPIDPDEPVSAELLGTLDRFVCRVARMYGGTYASEMHTGMVPEVPYPERANVLLGKAVARPDEADRPYLIDCYPILRLEPVQFQEMMRRWVAYLEDMQERIEGGWQSVPLAAREVCGEVLFAIYQRGG